MRRYVSFFFAAVVTLCSWSAFVWSCSLLVRPCLHALLDFVMKHSILCVALCNQGFSLLERRFSAAADQTRLLDYQSVVCATRTQRCCSARLVYTPSAH
uniref:Uncharacterized protein n=1 Tax=Rhipicephalus zambeziensis TaxID=60191 RepID=A0A224Y636_9ACAR